MDAGLALKAVVAFAPVLALLVVYDRLDVFNLIGVRAIAALVAAGGLMAALSFLANWRVMDGFPIGDSAFSRYVAPPIEETIKALPIVALFAFNRLGFKLDALIAAFAVGAGFSLVENLWYFSRYSDANVTAWMIRGFGTAIMHGGATALFALISHEFTERQAEGQAARYRFNPLLFLPGLAAAIAVHSAFNHFPDRPLTAMAATMLLVPAVLFWALARSDRATQAWLAADAAAHRQALADIREGRFAASETGQAVQHVVARFHGLASADAVAYVELKTELVLRAEELILASQSGAAADPDAADAAKAARLDALERKLGRAVLAALSSRLSFSRNDLWELRKLRTRLRRG